MFTGENGLVCCFGPDVGIWTSGTMAEVATAVGAGAALDKPAVSGVS